MTRASQGLVLALLAALLLRLGLTDQHLYYVNEWMRWGLVGAGAMLLLFAVRCALSASDNDEPGDESHPPPLSSWLLLLPFLVIAIVPPQPLGSYLAERRANPIPADPASYFEPLPAGDAAHLTLVDFVVRSQFDTSQTLRDRPVRLKGFVSQDGDSWYVTRLSIRCCAADAAAYRVEVEGLPSPARDSWVEVTGVWVPPASGEERDLADPRMTGTAVREVPKPRNPYE